MVEEPLLAQLCKIDMSSGVLRRENAGMSSERGSKENPVFEISAVSGAAPICSASRGLAMRVERRMMDNGVRFLYYVYPEPGGRSCGEAASWKEKTGMAWSKDIANLPC